MIDNYPYRDYFYEPGHKKNILIVELGTRVTPIAGKPPRLTYSGDRKVLITNSNIYKEEFELYESLNSSDNLSFGSCEASVIKFTIRNDKSVPFLCEHDELTYTESLIKLYTYFDDDSETLLYWGTYSCKRDEESKDSSTRDIEAVDLIYDIRDLDVYNWYLDFYKEHEDGEVTVKMIRDELFKLLGTNDKNYIEYQMPIVQEEITLPNDNWTYKYDVTTEKLSAAQLLEDICEINGRFGHIGRSITEDNKVVFEYKLLPRYDSKIDKTNVIRNNKIKKGESVHDFYITKGIRTLSIYNSSGEEIAEYSKGKTEYTIKDEDGEDVVDEEGKPITLPYSDYNIYDNKFIDEITTEEADAKALKAMLKNIYSSIRYRTYTPFEITTIADPCREVGDRIRIIDSFDEYDPDSQSVENYKSYVLERRIKGIQSMFDTYTAKGDKVLPNFGDASNSSGYVSYGSSGAYRKQSAKSDKTKADGSVVVDGMNSEDLVEYIRNFGIRLLDEPSKVKYKMVEGIPTFKWKDPADISTFEPAPATWAGTVVVRKQGSVPRHRWDFDPKNGGILYDSTTRDEFLTDPLLDDGAVLPPIATGKKYYYGIFPYDTEGHYRYTKSIKVKGKELTAPVITSIKQLDDGAAKAASEIMLLADGPETETETAGPVQVSYAIPSNAEYSTLKMAYKKDEIPDYDGTYESVDITKDEHSVDIYLEEPGFYYFIIFAVTKDDELESNEVSARLKKSEKPVGSTNVFEFRSDAGPIELVSGQNFIDNNPHALFTSEGYAIMDTGTLTVNSDLNAHFDPCEVKPNSSISYEVVLKRTEALKSGDVIFDIQFDNGKSGIDLDVKLIDIMLTQDDKKNYFYSSSPFEDSPDFVFKNVEPDEWVTLKYILEIGENYKIQRLVVYMNGDLYGELEPSITISSYRYTHLLNTQAACESGEPVYMRRCGRLSRPGNKSLQFDDGKIYIKSAKVWAENIDPKPSDNLLFHVDSSLKDKVTNTAYDKNGDIRALSGTIYKVNGYLLPKSRQAIKIHENMRIEYYVRFRYAPEDLLDWQNKQGVSISYATVTNGNAGPNSNVITYLSMGTWHIPRAGCYYARWSNSPDAYDNDRTIENRVTDIITDSNSHTAKIVYECGAAYAHKDIRVYLDGTLYSTWQPNATASYDNAHIIPESQYAPDKEFYIWAPSNVLGNQQPGVAPIRIEYAYIKIY